MSEPAEIHTYPRLVELPPPAAPMPVTEPPIARPKQKRKRKAKAKPKAAASPATELVLSPADIVASPTAPGTPPPPPSIIRRRFGDMTFLDVLMLACVMALAVAIGATLGFTSAPN